MIAGRLWTVLISMTALLAVGCSGHTTPSTGQPVQGGVATFAEPANTTPNYIFPFMSTEYFSVTTISDLQYLMYRPLRLIHARHDGLPSACRIGRRAEFREN